MTVASDLTVMRLDEMVADLPVEERLAFERIFHVGVTHGELVPPESMYPWIEEHFGNVERVRQQKIVKVTNVVTLEGVLFNWLRSARPIWSQELDLEAELERNGGEPFDDVYTLTPEDTFGRVVGEWCVTASNIA